MTNLTVDDVTRIVGRIVFDLHLQLRTLEDQNAQLQRQLALLQQEDKKELPGGAV